MQIQEKEIGFKEVLNKKEYYEIRLESIGGLGANLLGKMVGELGLKYLDVNSSSFSSYGSEKTGTPVKGYVRYCKKEKEIRIHSPIIEPDLLVIFHQALLQDSKVWEGCTENTKILVAVESLEKENIHSMIGNLPEMEQKVIKYRFNFANDEKTKTLRQIGEELGVSAETVRQMEMRAVKRLKAQMVSA